MATSLDKWQNKVLFRHRHVKHFHVVKRLWKLVSISGDIRQNTSNYDVNTQCYFDSPVLRQNYWTDLHQIFTQCSGIRGAIQSCTNMALPTPFLNARMTKVGSLPFFLHKIGCHGNVPWDIIKRSRSIIYTQNAFIRCKDWKSVQRILR